LLILKIDLFPSTELSTSVSFLRVLTGVEAWSRSRIYFSMEGRTGVNSSKRQFESLSHI
jgi:hypothetical protein